MYYSVYYMLTPRCLLNCGYCFRDTSSESLKSELSLADKKRVIKTLIEDLRVRKLTLSGGEPTIIGGVKLTQFLDLIAFIREYKVKYPNLRVELLSNGILLEKNVLEAIKGVVNRITITLDAIDEEILRKIGRNTKEYASYIERFHKRIKDSVDLGFEMKLHSVITPVNYEHLEDLAKYIKENNTDFKINRWKFYQYMTYDDPIKDAIYSIGDDDYLSITQKLSELLRDTDIDVTFKNNELMIDSMMNLMHDGCMENIVVHNNEKTLYRSKPIWEYRRIGDLIKDLRISMHDLEKYHGYE